MTRIDDYRKALQGSTNWDPYLKKLSGLPGPRGNLELAQAVADEGTLELFERYIRLTPDVAPENTTDSFLAFCGAIGLGRLIAEGNSRFFTQLRALSSDPRWRMREAVAMALQRVGDRDMRRLLDELHEWSTGNLFEKRAVAAGLCEPRLLKDPDQALQVLDILNNITRSILQAKDRKSEAFIALRKGLGYCWSVAVVAKPDYGKKLMEQWMGSEDKDIRWIMKENLKKNRLLLCDPQWVSDMVKITG